MLSTALKLKLSQKAICVVRIFRRFDTSTIKTSLHEFNLKSYFSINLFPCHICVIQFNRKLKEVNLTIRHNLNTTKRKRQHNALAPRHIWKILLIIVKIKRESRYGLIRPMRHASSNTRVYNILKSA